MTFKAKRTFFNSFMVVIKLWLRTKWSYLFLTGLAAVMALAFNTLAPLWLAILGGLAWAVAMVPLLLVLQAWKIMSLSRKLGLPTFSFDEEGAACKGGEIETRIAWSGVKRMRFVGTTCLVYLTPSIAWFFDSCDLSQQELSIITDYARRAKVELIGSLAEQGTVDARN
ncbi:hypothetical protein [Dyella choica]|uniref:YcxB family protein n=1 Tax=Dyella choica TaxID=1927959 RepID=A0A432M2G8_9GAMM|nr:hypothetical protein [Dyella choica]RUL72167.1 hypothetical protein EKH80_17735 [Dyella choica]